MGLRNPNKQTNKKTNKSFKQTNKQTKVFNKNSTLEATHTACACFECTWSNPQMQPRPSGGALPLNHGRAASNRTIGARQHLLWLTSCSLLPSPCTAKPHTYPSTHTTPLHATALHHTLTPNTRHVSDLDKIVFPKYSSQRSFRTA